MARSGPEPESLDAPLRARAATLVRMARRSGRLVIGVALTREAVRARRAAAVLVAEDLSSHRRDALLATWREAGLPVYRGWSKDELGELAGKPAVAVLALTDRHLADGLAQLAAEGASPKQGEE